MNVAAPKDVDKMTPEELRAELEKLALEESFLGVIASLALTAEQFKRATTQSDKTATPAGGAPFWEGPAKD
jgi:hypothetical protein